MLLWAHPNRTFTAPSEAGNGNFPWWGADWGGELWERPLPPGGNDVTQYEDFLDPANAYYGGPAWPPPDPGTPAYSTWETGAGGVWSTMWYACTGAIGAEFYQWIGFDLSSHADWATVGVIDSLVCRILVKPHQYWNDTTQYTSGLRINLYKHTADWPVVPPAFVAGNMVTGALQVYDRPNFGSPIFFSQSFALDPNGSALDVADVQKYYFLIKHQDNPGWGPAVQGTFDLCKVWLQANCSPAPAPPPASPDGMVGGFYAG